MYLDYFNLQEKPFHITPNPRFIFLSKNHKEAFAHLLYGVRQRVGFLAMTGEVGTGKTTVLRTLLKQLEDSDYQVALIFNPCLTSRELLQTIHREFGISCRADEENLSSLHESLNRFLLAQRQQGKTVVLVVDEAQNLQPAVLEQLRLLSNLETETDKLLQLVIVGQPELEQLLKRHELRQLNQRITVRYHLHNMDAEDTVAYISHRLKVAGFAGTQIFKRSALEAVYKTTGGLPRLINILCDRALLVAYVQGQSVVDRSHVRSAQTELAGQEPLRFARWPLYLFALFVLLGLSGFALYQAGMFDTLKGMAIDARHTEKAQERPDVRMAEVADKKEPLVDAKILEDLKMSVATLTETRSGLEAASAVLKLWGHPGLADLEIDRFHPLEAAIRDSGMSTIRFQGSLDRLLETDTPMILSLVLPNIEGKRYLSVLKHSNDKVKTVPRLTKDGWLPVSYLEQLWFGAAIIPWKNFEKLPYLNTPGEKSNGVRRTQELISLSGYPQLQISGAYDKETIATVTDLQNNMGLAPDGRIGARTLLQLYRLVGLDMPRLSEEVFQ